MYSFILNTVFAFAGVYWINEVAKNSCPEYYYNTLEFVFTEVIYQYSCIQIKYIEPFKKQAIDFIETHPLAQQILQFFKNSEKCIEYVKNGSIIYSCTKKDYEYRRVVDYDFIVYTSNQDKIIYYKEPNDFSRTAEPSSIKFLLVEISFKNNEKLGLKFKDDKKNYNYMIAGNRIDKGFLTYFLRKHYLEEIYNELHSVNAYSLAGTTDYTLKTLNDSAQIKTYGPDDSFIL